MISAIGKFTVKWASGIQYYCCFLDAQADYFKCLNGLRGIKTSRANGKDIGIVVADEYLYFRCPPKLDGDTRNKLKSIPKPFFISQFLENENALSDAQRKVYIEKLPLYDRGRRILHDNDDVTRKERTV